MLLLQIWHLSGLRTPSEAGGTVPQRTAGCEMHMSSYHITWKMLQNAHLVFGQKKLPNQQMP
jgi:hypothetical protein